MIFTVLTMVLFVIIPKYGNSFDKNILMFINATRSTSQIDTWTIRVRS